MQGFQIGASAARVGALLLCGALVGCASGGAAGTASLAQGAAAQHPASQGWRPLFDGRDLSNFILPRGDNGHWKILNGVIDYDAASESPDSIKDLRTKESFRDFQLSIDWRLKEYTGIYQMPIVLPDGSNQKDANGKDILVGRPNVDSGLYVRGISKAQVNMWAWPIGSGEVYGYRTDPKMPPEVRAGVTPKKNMDRPVGEWNHFDITLRNERLTVVENGETVIDNVLLPGLPATGPIGLQHHGGPKPNPAGSLVQFRNIYIKELP
jgi:hypothetical protein